ncbi:hypothetical protein, partial [Herbaspirillum huttiense]|uniref:hypothetical protein n=1 Tax=Herbaspirillum huttiense TaxID=863372 RepID=UPI003B3A4A52
RKTPQIDTSLGWQFFDRFSLNLKISISQSICFSIEHSLVSSFLSALQSFVQRNKGQCGGLLASRIATTDDRRNPSINRADVSGNIVAV